MNRSRRFNGLGDWVQSDSTYYVNDLANSHAQSEVTAWVSG